MNDASASPRTRCEITVRCSCVQFEKLISFEIRFRKNGFTLNSDLSRNVSVRRISQSRVYKPERDQSILSLVTRTLLSNANKRDRLCKP